MIYNNLPGVQSLFKNIYSNTGLEEIVITYKIETYTFLILSILAFVLYFVIALVVAKKNDKEEKELEKRETERIKPLAPYSSPFEKSWKLFLRKCAAFWIINFSSFIWMLWSNSKVYILLFDNVNWAFLIFGSLESYDELNDDII